MSSESTQFQDLCTSPPKRCFQVFEAKHSLQHHTPRTYAQKIEQYSDDQVKFVDLGVVSRACLGASLVRNGLTNRRYLLGTGRRTGNNRGNEGKYSGRSPQ